MSESVYRKFWNELYALAVIAIAVLLLVLCGCGGGGGGDDGGSSESIVDTGPGTNQPAVSQEQSGVFLDSAVAGLSYATPTRSGVTDEDGTFFYLPGERVVFSMGNFQIGEALGKGVLTPVDLMGPWAEETDDAVVNLARLLQTLDEDGDPGNGIVLSEQVLLVVNQHPVDFDTNPETFANSPGVTGLMAELNQSGLFPGQGGRALRSADAALRHLRSTLDPADQDGDGYTVATGDCNNNNPSIHPFAQDICGDGIDQDCSGGDQSCTALWYLDGDRDGFPSGISVTAAGRPSLSHFLATELISQTRDCRDNDSNSYPGAEESCGDGIDQDCNGSDLPCPAGSESTWYVDNDGDGFGSGRSVNAVNRPGAGYFLAIELETVGGDCDDTRASVHPGGTEVCGDGLDQDCNGSDLACPSDWYYDGDGDGYGTGVPQNAVTRPGNGYFTSAELTAVSGDCVDANPAIHPGKEDICGDGIDQDCSGADLVCPLPEEKVWYQDYDGDHYSDGESVTAVNQPGAGYYLANQLLGTTNDCDDGDSAVHPGAEEICGDGIDQNCNGADLSCPVLNWYQDFDGDGYSDGETVSAVNPPAAYYYLANELLATSGDCNDGNAGIHPEAEEVCGDGVDQDCVGGDLECPGGEEVTWYRDDDRDGYSDGTTMNAVDRPSDDYFEAGDLLALAGDCNDTSASVYPGAAEICGDGIDQDCSGGDLACSGVESSFEVTLRGQINNYRVQNGLGTLAFDINLYNMADEHNQYLKATYNQVANHDGTWAHAGFNDRANQCFALGFSSAVENVGYGQWTPEMMFDGWKNSAGHNANMLSNRMTHVGVAELLMNQAGYHSEGRYWTMFACGN